MLTTHQFLGATTVAFESKTLSNQYYLSIVRGHGCLRFTTRLAEVMRNKLEQIRSVEVYARF
jgi:hypothetical protein